LVDKYDGTRLLGVGGSTYERQADFWLCPTDPDATPLRSQEDDTARLGYHLHYVVDGGKARVILAAVATPASIADNTPMLDLARWVRFRWHLHPAIAVGDAKYGTFPNIVGLEQDGIRAYLATTDYGKRTQRYSIVDFQFDHARNCYVCPQGQDLPLARLDASHQVNIYQARRQTCRQCPARSECTTEKRDGRRLRRSIFQDYLDRVHLYHQSTAYKKAIRKRAVWVEPLFAEAKLWHNLSPLRVRTLYRVNIRTLLIAAGQNIMRLLKPPAYSKQHPPATTAALQLPLPLVTVLAA
jgi:hypothetical protein